MSVLEGLKILDFTTLLPGPYATLLLADMGAEVLKISSKDRFDMVTNWPPLIENGDITASAAWLGRNKKNIYLNLKKDKSIEAVKKLIMEYDIIIEQFRPGVMKRLGLDYDTLNKINPKIIYCSLTGYGQTGELKDKAGHDINYLSRSGLMNSSGKKEDGPSLYNMQVADLASGSMNSVVSILAAVYNREKRGIGEYIDISMLDGMIPFNTMDGVSFLTSNNEPGREDQVLNGGGIYNFYETKDGEYMSVASLEPKFFHNLCIALDLEDWADGEILKKDLKLVKETLKKKFKEKTKEEWCIIFKDIDACVEPVLSLKETMEDKHLNHRNMFVETKLPHKKEITVKQPGCPIKFLNSPVKYEYAGYPEGYNTKEILNSLGYDDKDIEDMI